VNYSDFLKSKIDIAPETGFDVPESVINPALKPHQRDSVRWAIKGGRRALFQSFGLGKTAEQLEWCRIVTDREGGTALIILPLGVKQEFARDAVQLLGWEAAPPYVRTMAEVKACGARVCLTNYERVRDGDIDPAFFTAVSLDEASVLRSYGSKTYQEFTDKMRGVRYKLVCTATPSPNRYKELIHYAGYLEIMDTGQALTRFFQRDSTKANNLTLYPAREAEFWLWISTWALFLTKPSDIGYDDAGYALPPITVRWHTVAVDHATAGTDKHGQVKLIRDAALSLLDSAREKRDSIAARVAAAREIVDASPEDHFILWHDLEDERRAIKAALPEAVEIYGTQDLETREKNTIDFSEGRFRILATKKELSGSGCNFQRHCHRAVFLGIDYEFNDFIQAIHRIYRFLQDKPVVIDIIRTESEQQIARVLGEKWAQHDRMVERMTEIIKKYGLSGEAALKKVRRSLGVKRVEVKGERFRAVNNDSVDETAKMAENSVDMILTSIPFSNHYEYSASYNDFGHNTDTARFFGQMDFLSPELLRVLAPGRVFACHVKDRVLFGNATGTGMPTMEPFHALCIQHYMRHGFQYMGMITVLTDVVRENNQTYRLGWTEQCKDGTKMGVGCPEYILLFRKLPSDTSRAYADRPVSKSKEEYTRAQWQIDAHGFWRSSGDRLISKDELEAMPVDRLQAAFRSFTRDNVYSYAEHVALARKLDAEDKLPASFMVCGAGSWSDQVWDDINRMRTFNTAQSQRRQEMHVCPLQLDIVERLINRYSAPGDVVYDPFAGLFTVPERAVRAGRFGIGCELNADYFRDGVGYLKAADAEVTMPTLFDLLPEMA
jgi:DNA modification methylase